MLLSSYNITSRSSSSGRQWWMSAGSGLQLKLLNGGIGWTLIPYNSVKELDTKRYKLVNLSVAQKKLMFNGHCSVNIEKEWKTASSTLQFKWELHVILTQPGSICCNVSHAWKMIEWVKVGPNINRDICRRRHIISHKCVRVNGGNKSRFQW